MKKRVLSAADWVAKGTGESQKEALQRIAVSPQCGFSTHESGYPLNLEEEKKKLALVREIADEIWGEA
jgi:methionine synthase II (cobalamin-independent)